MKRILLVSPRRGSDFAERRSRRNAELDFQFPRALMPPLDLATIKGLTPPEIEVDIWDESIQEPITDDTPFSNHYDLVGVTAYNLHIPWALNLASIVRRRGIPVVIGGPGASAAPEQCRGIFDTVFIGEAEFTWPQFLDDFRKGSPRREYRQVERPDVTRSPMPDWQGFPSMSRDYLLGAVQATRGCPFDCEFCDVIHLFGRQPRHKAIDTLLGEVTELHRLGMRLIFFCDDNFIGRPQYAKDLLRELISLNKTFDRPMGYTTQLTMNVVRDDELLELLADANFHWVLIGIESPREASLRETNKPQNYRLNMVEAIRKIQSHGILVKGSMIVGFDHDDQAVFDETYEFLRECRVLDSGLSMLHAYPGTPLLTRLQRDGRVVVLSDKELWRNTRPTTNIIPKQLTRVQLFEGYKSVISRLRSWEYFGACAKEIVENIRRKPQVSQAGPPDPARIAQGRRAVEQMEEGPRKVVIEVIQHTLLHAPFMMEKMVSALFRFGGLAEWLPNLLKELDAQIERESAPGFTLTTLSTTPKVPAGFRDAIQNGPFPRSVELLRAGLNDDGFLAAALVKVWKDFLIRWSETFERFEDYHHEYLRELCERAVELANSGELADAVVNGALGPLGRVEMRRLAGEVLVSVEQDLRGSPRDELVPLVRD